MTPLAKRIAEAIAQNSSQADVARGLGVRPSAVSHWTHGHREPDTATLQRLSAFLNVRAEWLAFGTGTMRLESPSAPLPRPARAKPPKRKVLPARTEATSRPRSAAA